MNRDLFELHSDLEVRHWWFLGRRAVLGALVRELVPAGEGARLVDIGCGTGANVASFATDYRATGIDPSEAAIEFARELHPEVEFLAGAVEDVGLEALAAANIVVCSDVLEHVADDFALLSQILSAMTPGTPLLLTVPAHPHLWSPHDVGMSHYRRYTPSRFKRAWEDLPVQLSMLSYFNSRLYPVVRLIRWLNERAGRTPGGEGTDLSLPAAPLNAMLGRIFGGERARLLGALKNGANGYATGVSLLAVLVRGEGTILPRSKPSNIEPDLHDPVAHG